MKDGGDRRVFEQNTSGLEVVQFVEDTGVFADFLRSVTDECLCKSVGADGLAQKPCSCGDFGVGGIGGGQGCEYRREAVSCCWMEVIHWCSAVC